MAYGTEISAEKSKIMTYSMNIIGADISINGQMLQEVTILSTWDLATLCKDGTCSAEVCIRIASAMAAMARLKKTCRCNTFSFTSKFKLYKSLVTSILLCVGEMWTLFADSGGKIIKAFESSALSLIHI